MSLPETGYLELFRFQKPVWDHVLIHSEDNNYYVQVQYNDHWAELFGANQEFYGYAHYDPIRNKFAFAKLGSSAAPQKGKPGS